ncbi:MAG: hypothetical protein WBD63_08430, partial [Phycisphaerae bacterium]
RWLLAALGLGMGALALVWVSAASAPRAEAQGAVGGADPSSPCRYQLAVAPGYVYGDELGGRVSIRTRLYMLDQITGVLYTRDQLKDPKTGKTQDVWATRSRTARFVVDDPTQPGICPDCNGTGRLITPQGAKRCPTCNGTGKIAP